MSDSRLTQHLKSFARRLVSDHETGDLLYRLCDVAVQALDLDGAGILVEDVDGRLRYAVASDEMTARIEGLQLETREGPCMLAHDSAAPVLIGDLAAEHRFPAFTSRALEAGIRAVFTFPMVHGGSPIGVLDLYRRATGPLSEDEAGDGQLLADMAATAVLNRRAYDDAVAVTDRLQSALDARIAMEQAKGRISERNTVSTDVAETMIYAFAKGRGEPVGDIVRRIGAGDLHQLTDEAKQTVPDEGIGA